MTTERLDADPRAGTDEGSPFVAADEDFVDCLCRFLRTIPIYPDGHSRVVSVSERLHATASRLSEPVVVEVADRGLLVNGQDRGELGPGPLALRASLLATAIVRAVFHPDAPPASYVAFARALQRNARLAANGHLAFADLWMAPIAGIEVHELVFAADGFVGDAPGATEKAGEDDAPTVLGGVAGEGDDDDGGFGPPVPGSVGAGTGTGVASDDGEPAPPAPPVVRRPLTVSKDLRELVGDDPELEASIFTLEVRLLSDRSARIARSGADVLEHLIRALPLEARIDPRKGLAVLRRVVDRLLAKLPENAAVAAGLDLSTRFFQVLESVFPRREGPAEEPAPAPSTADALQSPEDAASFDELHFLDDSIFEALGVPRDEGPCPAPELVAEGGAAEQAAVILHTALEEPEGARREELGTLAIAAYVARPRGGPTPCLVKHLSEAIGAPPATRDVGRIALLESIAAGADIPLLGALPTLTLDTAVELFPACFGVYLRAGGRAGAVARRVGRERVLSAAAALLAPRGPLAGDLVEKVLGERTLDALPFFEALLVVTPASRPRVARALRTLDLKSLAAVALRVVPETRFTDGFLQALCRDGFAGLDAKGLVVEAAAALSSLVVDREGEFDVRTRIYATAALGSFPPVLAEPALKTVAKHRLFGGAPKEIRHAAEDILRRFARAAAEARPIP